jgi:hypothetical protein
MIVDHELYMFRDTDCIVSSFTIDENDWQVLTTEVPEALNSIIELSKQCTAYTHEDRPVSDAVVDWLQDFFAHGGVDGGPFTHVSDEDASLQLPPLRPVPVAFINAHNDDADSLDFSLGVSEDTLDFMDCGKPVANYQDDDDLIYSSDPHDDFDKRLESNQQHAIQQLQFSHHSLHHGMFALNNNNNSNNDSSMSMVNDKDSDYGDLLSSSGQFSLDDVLSSPPKSGSTNKHTPVTPYTNDASQPALISPPSVGSQKSSTYVSSLFNTNNNSSNNSNNNSNSNSNANSKNNSSTDLVMMEDLPPHPTSGTRGGAHTQHVSAASAADCRLMLQRRVSAPISRSSHPTEFHLRQDGLQTQRDYPDTARVQSSSMYDMQKSVSLPTSPWDNIDVTVSMRSCIVFFHS